MTRSSLAGLWHVRGGPLAFACLLVTVLLVGLFPLAHIVVSTAYDLPGRGIGAPEIGAVALASVLPSITIPRFDERELLAGPQPRVAHALFTVAVLWAPAIVVWAWRGVIAIRVEGADVPPLWGFVESMHVVSCIALCLCVLAGPIWSVLLTPALFACLTVAQQAHPTWSVSTAFATATSWQTNTGMMIAVSVTTLALAWWSRSIPLGRRRGRS